MFQEFKYPIGCDRKASDLNQFLNQFERFSTVAKHLQFRQNHRREDYGRLRFEQARFLDSQHIWTPCCGLLNFGMFTRPQKASCFALSTSQETSRSTTCHLIHCQLNLKGGVNLNFSADWNSSDDFVPLAQTHFVTNRSSPVLLLPFDAVQPIESSQPHTDYAPPHSAYAVKTPYTTLNSPRPLLVQQGWHPLDCQKRGYSPTPSQPGRYSRDSHFKANFENFSNATPHLKGRWGPQRRINHSPKAY